ncbi:hypothetical protein Pelo_1708 [Pelomyxa schiedti]|nr:hypothetical protein Pelo_1708 [Pelomyxa schiedti]
MAAVTPLSGLEESAHRDLPTHSESEDDNDEDGPACALVSLSSGSVVITTDGSALLLNATIHAPLGGFVDSSGALGSSGLALIRLKWDYDDRDRHRVWVEMKNPGAAPHDEMRLKVSTNLKNKTGRNLRMQRARIYASRTEWISIFHTTRLPSLPTVVTFRIEIDEEE